MMLSRRAMHFRPGDAKGGRRWCVRTDFGPGVLSGGRWISDPSRGIVDKRTRGTVLYVVAVVGGIHGSGSFVLVETQLKDFYRTATCGLTMISTGLYSDPCAPIGEDAVSAFVGSMGFHERR
jgi:hypothetical protein